MASATNSVSGLLPGVTVNLVAKSTDPITVRSRVTSSGLADKVQTLVDALNQVQGDINQLIAYDPQSKQASPLTGDAAANQVMSALTSAVIKSVDDATPKSPGLAGVSIDSTGKFTFDKTKFHDRVRRQPRRCCRVVRPGRDGRRPNGAVRVRR